MAMDLELNMPSGKIISIGYCVAKLDTGEILENEDIYIQIDEPITEFIQKLTGIDDKTLAGKGVPLTVGYEKLSMIHEHYQCFINPVVWGQGDSKCLKEQIGNPERFLFGRREVDVKTLSQVVCMAKQIKHNGGLAKSLLKHGLAFKGRKHCSKDDALNTWLLFKHLVDKFKLL